MKIFMKTSTNWEDNQLMAQAAESALREQKRARGIDDVVRRGIVKIAQELRDDYKLTAEEAIAAIKRHV